MFIKNITAILFGMSVAVSAHATASLPCNGKSHDVLLHIGDDNGDLVADLTIYNNDAGEVEYATAQFTSSHVEWKDYEGNNSSNNLYVTTTINGETKIIISVKGNNGILTINNKTQDIVCDWRR